MNLQSILENWKIKANLDMLLDMWNESHRHYHNLDHLNDVVSQINTFYNESNCSKKDHEKLLLTALFHDIVYDPLKNDNEEKSAEFFNNCCLEKNQDTEDIKNMILDTKAHNASTNLSVLFNKFDMNIVERGIDELMQWESGIYNEYKIYGNDAYKQGRVKFLESLVDKYPSNSGNLSDLITWVKSNY